MKMSSSIRTSTAARAASAFALSPDSQCQMWLFCLSAALFFFNDTATTEIYTLLYTLSLHDALPILDVDGKPLTPADLAPPPAPAGPVALDAAQFAPHTDSSSVMLQGKAVGYTVSDVRRSRDSLLYVERSSLGSGTFEQRTTVLLDPADGSVRQVDQVTTQQGQKAETHLSYAGGRVKGQSAAPQQDGSIDRKST